MAVRCPVCRRDYDVTLFEYGRQVKCVCGTIVSLEHRELRDLITAGGKKEDDMANITFKVGNIYCYDCVMALKKFIGSLDGIRSIEMEGEDRVDITYDPSELSEDKVRTIVSDSVEKLGFKIVP